MIEATLVFGLVIITGVIAVLWKMPRYWSLWILGHHIPFDLAITVLVLIVHWGTMTGVMAATVAGLCCSLTTSIGRWLFGYRIGTLYYVGVFDQTTALITEQCGRSDRRKKCSQQ